MASTIPSSTCVRSPSESRRLFVEGVDAQRVPVVPPPEARVAVLRDVVLGRAEDLTHLDASTYLGASPVVRLLEHPEEAPGRGLRPAVDERAAPVAPVAAHGGAAVELDEVALLQARVALRVDPDPDPGADGGQDPLV